MKRSSATLSLIRALSRVALFCVAFLGAPLLQVPLVCVSVPLVTACTSTTSASSDAGVQLPRSSSSDTLEDGADVVALPLPDTQDRGDAVAHLPDAGAQGGPDATGDATLDVKPPTAAHNILFVGNSFTFVNQLDVMWEQLHLALVPDGAVDSRRVASAGYRLVQHLADATNASAGAPIRPLLVTEPPAWGYVVLQEQSQIPGFPDGVAEHDASVAAAVQLAALADAAGAHTLLFETWGYRAGDEGNAALFPDFDTMQSRLTDGYAQMAAAVLADGHPASVLPAGQAFRAVYLASTPGDPTSLFARLYSDDGRHPSVLGTYLVACTLAALLAPEHRVGTDWAPQGVAGNDAAALRAAAESLWK